MIVNNICENVEIRQRQWDVSQDETKHEKKKKKKKSLD